MIDQTSSINHIASLTHQVIHNLFELQEFISKQSQPEILETLSKVKGQVHELQDTATKQVKQFIINGEMCEKQLELIERRLGNNCQELDEAQEKIKGVNQSLSVQEYNKENLANQLNSLMETANNLHKEIEEAQQVDENDLLALIPLYGIYHIGKKVYDLVRAETSLKEEMQTFQNEIQKSEDIYRTIQDGLSKLSKELADYEARIGQLTAEKNTLQQKREESKIGIVMASNAQLYCSTLIQKLETIEARTNDIQDLINYLNQEVSLTMSEEKEVLALKEALIKFGEYADNFRNSLPTGTFQETSRNIKLKLFAECQKIDGTWQASSLDITNCIMGDITNVDGKLVNTFSNTTNKERTESYKNTSRNHKLILSAECQKIDGTWQEVSLDITNGAAGDLANIDGKLILS